MPATTGLAETKQTQKINLKANPNLNLKTLTPKCNANPKPHLTAGAELGGARSPLLPQNFPRDVMPLE